jgi:pimeloyl-ACP methyl ester carboxylesterase
VDGNVSLAQRREYVARELLRHENLLPGGLLALIRLRLLSPVNPKTDIKKRRSASYCGYTKTRTASVLPVSRDALARKKSATFIAGERDPVRALIPGLDLYANPGIACADFRGSTIMPGIGHWVQQEAPRETNEALEAFVRGL